MSKTTIEYKGVVTTVEAGESAVIRCEGDKMEDEVVVTAGSGSSSLPIEVSTESEMNTLLETSAVGSVYKYTGTTGTYENGALYVVEESE